MFDTTSQNRKDARKRSAKRYQHQLISSRLALENHETLSSKLLQCTLQPQPQPGKRNKTKKQVDHRAVPLSSSGSNELLYGTKKNVQVLMNNYFLVLIRKEHSVQNYEIL